MATPFLFFDCWYTLFTADLYEDIVRITDLLDVPYDKAFIKTFEQAYMVTPELDLAPGTRRLHHAVDRPVQEARVAAIVEILEAGFERQRPYDDTLAGLQELSQTYRLGLITNSSRGAFEHLSRTYELDARFDVILPSYEVGTIKPDPRIFREALAKAGVPASQAVMIGDSSTDDFHGSMRAGFTAAILLDRRNREPEHSHRITKLDQLESALKSLSI